MAWHKRNDSLAAELIDLRSIPSLIRVTVEATNRPDANEMERKRKNHTLILIKINRNTAGKLERDCLGRRTQKFLLRFIRPHLSGAARDIGNSGGFELGLLLMCEEISWRSQWDVD